MKPIPPKNLKADSKYAMLLARYPVRLLHDTTLGVLLGGILAIGLQSLQQAHTTPIVHVDEQIQQIPTPAPTPSLKVVASPGTKDDFDGDGIPNDWETAHSHNPNNAADAASDFDSDGLTTLQEYELWNRTNGQAGNPLGKWTTQEMPIEPIVYDTQEYDYFYQGSYVAAANDAGDIVISYYSYGTKNDGSWTQTGNSALIHSDGTQQAISIPGKTSGFTYASDINDRGDVLLQWYSEDWNTSESYILKSDTSVTQLTLNGNACLAYRMNNFGDWIGYEITTSGEWKSVQVVDGVNVLPNEIFTSWYYFLDINDYGQAIGSYYDVMENDYLTFTQLGSMFFSTGRAGDNPTFNEATYQWQWPAALNQWGEFAGGGCGYMPNGEYRNSAFFFDGRYHDVSPREDQNYAWATDLSDAGMVLLTSYSYAMGNYTSHLWRDSVSVNCDALLPAETLPSDGSFVYPTKLTPNGKIFLSRYDASWQTISIITLTSNQDADSDGMPDDWEEFYEFNPYANDSFLDYDSDGTSNLGEFLLRSDPQNAPVFDPNGNVIDTRPGVDTDGDGVPNNWEYVNGMNYQDPADAPQDFDRDGYTNLQEYRLNTDPRGAPSYRIRKLGPFPAISNVDLNNAKLGNGVSSDTQTYFNGDQITEQVFFPVNPTTGGKRPAMWSQTRSTNAGQLSLYQSNTNDWRNIVAQSPSGAMLTQHGYNPGAFTYWSSPMATPIALSGAVAANNINYLYNATFSPSGNFLYALRYNNNGSYEPIVWKMPTSNSISDKPVVLTAPVGAVISPWLQAYINDYGIITGNGSVTGQNRPLVWTLNSTATSAAGSILPTLTGGTYAYTVGLSNHSNPIIAGYSTMTGNKVRATVWKYNSATSLTATNLGTLKNGNISQIVKISPNGTLAGTSNTLVNNSLKNQIFASTPVFPENSSSINPASYALTPQGEPTATSSTISTLTDSGEVIVNTYNYNPTYEQSRSLARHGRTHSLEQILPPNSGYTLKDIKSINTHGTLLVTAWKDNLLETLLLTPDQDTDGDGLTDAFENANQFNAFVKNNPTADTDSDGLTDLLEFTNGTNPRLADSDSDGMKDGWELSWGLDPLDASDASLDPDGDRVTNLRESQIGTNPTGIYKVETRLTDTSWEYPSIAAVGDDGTIIHTGQSFYDSGTTPDGMQNWYSGDQTYFALPASYSDGTPSIALTSYHYTQSYNNDWTIHSGAWEYPTYYFDASSGAIIADIQRGSYTFDGANWNSSETSFLISDILTHQDESSWNSWESIQNILYTSGALDENETIYPWANCVSPNGRHRIYGTNNGRLIHLNEKGELVEVLPYNDGWTHVNNDGVLISYQNQYVEEGYGIPAHYEPQIITYSQYYGNLTYHLTASNEDSAALNYPSIVQFSDDQKILLSQYEYTNGTSRTQYFLADLTTRTLKKVKSPGLGNEYITHLSTTNGRMVGSGTKPWQITPDGTSIRLEAQLIQSSLGSAPQTLKSLYPQGVTPVHIAPNGTITATTSNSQGQQQIIRIVLANDSDHDGIPDDQERYIANYLLANSVVNANTQQDLLSGNLNADYDYTGDGLTALELCNIIISSNMNSLSDSGQSSLKDELDMEYVFLEQRRIADIARGTHPHSGEDAGFLDTGVGSETEMVYASTDYPNISANSLGNIVINQLLDEQAPWSNEYDKTMFPQAASFLDLDAERPQFGWDVSCRLSQSRIKIAVNSLSKNERKIKILKITRGREALDQNEDDAYHGSEPSSWVDISSEVIELTIPANKLVSTEWKLIEPKMQTGMRFITTIEPFVINSADKYLCGNLPGFTFNPYHWYNGMEEDQTIGIIFKNKQTGEEYRYDNFENVFVYEGGLSEDLLNDDDILSEAEVSMNANSQRLKQDVVFYRKNGRIHFRALFDTPGKIEISMLYNGQEITGPSSDSNGNPLPPETTEGGIEWQLHADDNLGGLIDKLDAIVSNTWSDNRRDQELQQALCHGASELYITQLMENMNQGPSGPVVGDPGHPRLISYQQRNLVIKMMMPVWEQLDHCYQNGQLINFEESMIAAAKGLIAMLKGYAEGMWSGLKSDLEGVKDSVVGIYKLVTEPAEVASSIKKSFSALREMTWNEWKGMPIKLIEDFLTKSEDSLPWKEPSGFEIAAYVIGFTNGYLSEQIAITMATGGASKAAAAGKFGTIIADLIKVARGLKKALLKPATTLAKKAKTSLYRWHSQFARSPDAMRYLRKISDYSYKDYLPDCPGLLTP